MDSSAFAQIYPGGLFLFLTDEPLPDAVDAVIGDAEIIADLACLRGRPGRSGCPGPVSAG